MIVFLVFFLGRHADWTKSAAEYIDYCGNETTIPAVLFNFRLPFYACECALQQRVNTAFLVSGRTPLVRCVGDATLCI
jgi:hypothetical protein